MPSIIVPNDQGTPEEQRLLKDPDIAVKRENGFGVRTVNNTLPTAMDGGKVREGYALPVQGWTNEYYQNQLAENQGSLNKLMHGTGRIASTLVGEVAKLAPMLVGGVVALAGNAGDLFLDGDQFDGMSWMNNKAVQWIDEKQKEFDETYLPVYSDSDYENKNWTEKLATTDFWATQGASGVGFLLSFFAPGAVLKGLGLVGKTGLAAAKLGEVAELVEIGKEAATLGKIAKTLSNEQKLAKFAEVAAQMGKDPEVIRAGYEAYQNAGKTLNATSSAIKWAKPAWDMSKGQNKLGRAIDTFTVASTNGLFESISEGNETYNTVYDNLKRSNPNMSEEELGKAAGDAAATTFKYNLPLLMVSNLILESVILNKFDNVLGIGKRTAIEAEEDAARLWNKFEKLGIKDKTIDQYLKENLRAYGMKDFAKEVGFKFPLGIAKEGFMEEGLQNSIQRYAKEGKNEGFFEGMGSIGEQWMKSVSDTGDNEFWESVALGAALGGFGEAGVGTGAQIIRDGGFKELDYNRRLFGGQETAEPSKIMKAIGKSKKYQEDGIVTEVEQLMRNMKGDFDVKEFFETNDKGEVVYDEATKQPKMIKENVSKMMQNTLFRNIEIKEIEKQLEMLNSIKTENKAKSGVQQIVQSQIDSKIEELEANKNMLNDMVMSEQFSHLFGLGILAEDMTKSVVENLVKSKREQIKTANPMINDADLDIRIREFQDKLTTDMKTYKENYDLMQQVNKYDKFYTPSKEDSTLFKQWVNKQSGVVMAHLFFNKAKSKLLESNNKRIEELGKVKEGFTKLEELMLEVYNQDSLEFKRFKDEYDKITNLTESIEKKVEEELTEEAKENFKKYGESGITDEKGNKVTEEEYVKQFVDHSKKNNKGRYNKFEVKKKARLHGLRTELARKLITDPDIAGKLPQLDNIKGILEEMDKTNSYVDYVEYAENQAKIIKSENDRINSELRISKSNFRKAIQPQNTKERFLEYKKNKEALDKNLSADIPELNDYIKQLETSDYISENDITRYNYLSNKVNKTTEEDKEFTKLKSKLIDENDNIKKPDYAIINGKLFVHNQILMTVIDNYNLTELTDEEKKEYRELIKKEEKSTNDKMRITQLANKLPFITIALRSNKWMKDGKQQWKTFVHVINDTGLRFVTERLKNKFKGKFVNMNANTKDFFNRFSEYSIIDKNSEEGVYYKERQKYYARLNNRLSRINKIEKLISRLPDQLKNNINIANDINSIIDAFRDIDSDTDEETLLNVINGLFNKLEIDLGYLGYKETLSSIDRIKALAKTSPTLQEAFDKSDNEEDKKILEYIINKYVESGNMEREQAGKVSLLLAMTAYENLIKRQFGKKNKSFYILKQLKDSFKSVKTIEIVPGSNEQVQFVTKISQEDMIHYINTSIDLLDNMLEGLKEDSTNVKDAIELLIEENEIWRKEEFDVNELYDKVKDNYKQLTDIIGEIGSIAKFGGMPQYVNQIRDRQKEIDKILYELNMLELELPVQIKELEIRLNDLRKDWIDFTSIDTSTLTEEEIKERFNTRLNKKKAGIGVARELKVAQNKLDKVNNVLQKDIVKTLEEQRENMLTYFVSNSLYKTLNKTYSSVKQSEKVNEESLNEIDDPNKAILTGRVDDLWVLTTNDVEYETKVVNGKISLGDRFEIIQVGDRLVRVPKLAEKPTQLAFQHFIKNANMKQHDLIHFGVTYMLKNGIIIKDGKTYKLGEVKGNAAQHKKLFEEIITSMNDYASSGGDINQLEEAVFTVPFDNQTSTFYIHDNSYAITAMMHPENRFEKYEPQSDALFKYIRGNARLMAELFPDDIKMSKKNIAYITRESFYKRMSDPAFYQNVKNKVKEYFMIDFKELSDREFSILDIKSFSKGFKYRAFDIGTSKIFRRPFTPEDEVKNIFVITPIEVNKKTKSTSSVFYDKKYYGMVAAKYADGTEELLEVRNLDTLEAETVIALLYLKTLEDKPSVDGNPVFPVEKWGEKEEWNKGLIQSLIRYGTTQGTEYNKGHNPSNWTDKKKYSVKNQTSQKFDVWFTKNKLHWIDSQDIENVIDLTEPDALVKEVDGNLVFNKRLIDFLQTKKFNIPTNIAKGKSYKIPVLNKKGFSSLLVNSDTTSEIFSLTDITDHNSFFMYGNKNHTSIVKTGIIPEKPLVVSRNIKFKPTGNKFSFTANEKKKITSGKLNPEFEELKMKIKDAPDGFYQVLINNQVFNIEIIGGLIKDDAVTGEKELETKLTNLIKSLPTKSDVSGPARDLLIQLKTISESDNQEDKSAAIEDAKSVIRTWFNMSFRDGSNYKLLQNFFKDVDLSYNRNGKSYTNEEARAEIEEIRKLYIKLEELEKKKKDAGGILGEGFDEEISKTKDQWFNRFNDFYDVYESKDSASDVLFQGMPAHKKGGSPKDFIKLEEFINKVIVSYTPDAKLSVSSMIKKDSDYTLYGKPIKVETVDPVEKTKSLFTKDVTKLIDIFVEIHESVGQASDEMINDLNSASDDLAIFILNYMMANDMTTEQMSGAATYWKNTEDRTLEKEEEVVITPVVYSEDMFNENVKNLLTDYFTNIYKTSTGKTLKTADVAKYVKGTTTAISNLIDSGEEPKPVQLTAIKEVFKIESTVLSEVRDELIKLKNPESEIPEDKNC